MLFVGVVVVCAEKVSATFDALLWALISLQTFTKSFDGLPSWFFVGVVCKVLIYLIYTSSKNNARAKVEK